MSKDITYSSSCRGQLLKGVDQVAEAVRPTLGPRGRNCLWMEQESGRIIVSNNGAEIAKTIELADPWENLGAQLVKEAAAKVSERVGDGSTTTIILIQSMLREAYKVLEAGYNPVELRKGMQMAMQMAVACIRKMAAPVADDEALLRVASVSAADEELGRLVAEAVKKAGAEGVVSIEESQGVETELDYQEGIVFERGYLHSAMVTDPDNRIAELRDPYIFITDYKLDNPSELVNLLEIVRKAGKSLLVISDGIEPAVMGFFLRNKEALGMDIVGVLPPLYGEGRKWRLEDLAVQTGGSVISGEFGLRPADVTEEMLGTARYVRVERARTVILGEGGDREKIALQEMKLRRMIEITDYEFNKKRYQERLAKFVSGVATIRVGGWSEVEMRERKNRVEAAYHTVRAAREEGVVPGGGITLVDIMGPIRAYQQTLKAEKRIGVGIVLRALEQPFLHIVENAGMNGSELLAKVREQERGYGYDVQRETGVDMMEAGVLDSAKVVRVEIMTAVSTVGTMFTLEAGLTESRAE